MGKKKWKRWARNQLKSETVTLFKQCHEGNQLIFDKPFRLYAAGGSRGLRVYKNSIVLDLANQVTTPDIIEFEACLPSETLVKAAKPEYSVVRVPWDDGSAPWSIRRQFWEELAQWLKEQERSVIVCCVGGHGRTGTAVVLLTHFLRPDLLNFYKCPVRWLRKVYCEEAVETHQQVSYIESITSREVEELPSWGWVYYKGKGQHWWENYQKEQQGYLLPESTSNQNTVIINYGHDKERQYEPVEMTAADICNDCESKAPEDCYDCYVWKQAVGEQPADDTEGRAAVCQACYDHHIDIGIRNIDCSECNLWNVDPRKEGEDCGN